MFAVFYLTVTYIEYRFKQVNEKIMKCKSARELIEAIEEHEQICKINHRNNYLLSKLMFIFNYILSPMLDISMYRVVYVQTIFIVKAAFTMISVCIIIFLYIGVYSSARMSKSAHLPYKRLNSLIANQRGFKIPLDCKLKVNGMIEKLSGPSIAVYCADLFALNNKEFYLFITSLIMNYLLIIHLLKP